MTASLENRTMLLIENCRPAGDNISWTMPENRGDLFGSKSNSDLWPFRFLSISTDGINTELTKPLCGGKRKGFKYTTTKQASKMERCWKISDRIGRGAAMDYVFSDPLLTDPIFVDIKALDYPMHFGSDKKIRLAGGTMAYCLDKLKVVSGKDNHPYLLHLVWENSVTIFEWKVNLTRVFKAWEKQGKIYKAFNIRKHGQSFDLEWNSFRN